LTPTQTEHFQFAERLNVAITDKGYKQSPTVIGNLLNQHFQGRPVTPHTARNWLLGKAMPTQDKLVLLAKLLDTSPEQLRFGRSSENTNCRVWWRTVRSCQRRSTVLPALFGVDGIAAVHGA
jgi:transcriptional regulator with XRE-family HTH domain